MADEDAGDEDFEVVTLPIPDDLEDNPAPFFAAQTITGAQLVAEIGILPGRVRQKAWFHRRTGRLRRGSDERERHFRAHLQPQARRHHPRLARHRRGVSSGGLRSAQSDTTPDGATRTPEKRWFAC